MEWQIIRTGVDKAASIMQKDAELLASLVDVKNPILHLYEFQGESATYGHFLQPPDLFNLQAVEKRGFQLAKRPTGGGVIFHLWDLAFSVLVPACHPLFSHNTLDNYATVNRPVLAAAEEFLSCRGCELTPDDGEVLAPFAQHFCMAKPTRYDVMLQGRKVAGAAQRKTRHGFLHQGSLSLLLPSPSLLQELLLPQVQVVESMLTYTFPLLGRQASLQDLAQGRQTMMSLLQKHLTGQTS